MLNTATFSITASLCHLQPLEPVYLSANRVSHHFSDAVARVAFGLILEIQRIVSWTLSFITEQAHNRSYCAAPAAGHQRTIRFAFIHRSRFQFRPRMLERPSTPR